MQPCSPVSVLVANGDKLTSTQQVANFCWEMMGEKFVTTMLVLPVRGYDAILRVSWMKRVSPVVFDFNNNSIMVTWNNRKIELKQNPALSKVKVVGKKSDSR